MGQACTIPVDGLTPGQNICVVEEPREDDFLRLFFFFGGAPGTPEVLEPEPEEGRCGWVSAWRTRRGAVPPGEEWSAREDRREGSSLV